MEIHDRKRAEKALQGSEGRLRSLINAVPDFGVAERLRWRLFGMQRPV